MILRIVLDVFVIFGCGYIGWGFSKGMETRVAQLESLNRMLSQLAFNIGFLALPMEEAVGRTAESQEGAVKELLLKVSIFLKNYPHITVKEAWEEAVYHCAAMLCLEQDEIATMTLFAEHIGQGDIETALNAIRLASAKITLSTEEAREKSKKDGKLCKKMGFLCGALLVLLLA